MKKLLLGLVAVLFAGAAHAQFIQPIGGGGGGGPASAVGPFPVTVSGTVNSGGIPCFTSTTQMSSSGTLPAGQLLVGGGAGACPAGSSGTSRLGNADAAAPVAQTLSVQNVVTGTSNTAGANLTINGSIGTGTGAGGSIIFQTAAASTTGSTPNSLAPALTINTVGILAKSTGNAATIAFAGNTGTGLEDDGSTNMYLRANGARTAKIGSDGIVYAAVFSFGSVTTQTALLTGDAANTLAQRNGTNAQTLRVYGTFTDASNYERLNILVRASTSTQILTSAAGTGAARDLEIGTIGSSSLYFDTVNTSRWQVNTSGHFLAVTDNTYDIGANGASRPRTAYFGNQVRAVSMWVGGTSGSPAVNVNMLSSADGVLTLTDSTGGLFGRLQFGGTTSSFPAIKRSGTILQARLADDSAFASYQGKLTTDTNYTATPSVATGYLVLYDATGAAYKVNACLASGC